MVRSLLITSLLVLGSNAFASPLDNIRGTEMSFDQVVVISAPRCDLGSGIGHIRGRIVDLPGVGTNVRLNAVIKKAECDRIARELWNADPFAKTYRVNLKGSGFLFAGHDYYVFKTEPRVSIRQDLVIADVQPVGGGAVQTAEAK